MTMRQPTGAIYTGASGNLLSPVLDACVYMGAFGVDAATSKRNYVGADGTIVGAPTYTSGSMSINATSNIGLDTGIVLGETSDVSMVVVAQKPSVAVTLWANFGANGESAPINVRTGLTANGSNILGYNAMSSGQASMAWPAIGVGTTYVVIFLTGQIGSFGDLRIGAAGALSDAVHGTTAGRWSRAIGKTVQSAPTVANGGVGGGTTSEAFGIIWDGKILSQDEQLTTYLFLKAYAERNGKVIW